MYFLNGGGIPHAVQMMQIPNVTRYGVVMFFKAEAGQERAIRAKCTASLCSDLSALQNGAGERKEKVICDLCSKPMDAKNLGRHTLQCGKKCKTAK